MPRDAVGRTRTATHTGVQSKINTAYIHVKSRIYIHTCVSVQSAALLRARACTFACWRTCAFTNTHTNTHTQSHINFPLVSQPGAPTLCIALAHSTLWIWRMLGMRTQCVFVCVRENQCTSTAQRAQCAQQVAPTLYYTYNQPTNQTNQPTTSTSSVTSPVTRFLMRGRKGVGGAADGGGGGGVVGMGGRCG